MENQHIIVTERVDDIPILLTQIEQMVVVHSRKFSKYVLVPVHKSGKDKIFLGLLVDDN
jgi:hypothetical protein